MKWIILVVVCMLAVPAMASHIVGGEFELLYLSKNRYRISLIYYFDLKNNTFANPSESARPEISEPTITIAIFRKFDNAMMRSVTLFFSSKSRVSYTQPECSTGEILTDKIIYSAEITLSDADYSDQSGYYISWERCCRNYSITNIFSENPVTSSRYAGQTFYLEFPAIVKNGITFINSSPRLFPPLNDYACPRKPYYVDFAGIDDDGDSLAYSLVTPLNTKTADALPPGNLPRPRPYPNVDWRFPYSLSNIMGGEPDIKISSAGFLRVTPTQLGLFVFAVKVEEFRKGDKIGETRRDFQMLVIDCQYAEPPKILGKKMADANFIYDGNMSITFSNTVSDGDRCIQVQVSDPDSNNPSDKPSDNFSENITIKAVALNFKKNINNILPSETTATLTHGSTKTFDICFDKCPPFEGGPFQVGIIAYDDACSLPLTDTLKILVNIQPPANAKPYFTTPNVVEQVNEGDTRTYPVRGIDDDRDPLIVGVLADGFSFEKVGMELQQIKLDSGIYDAQLIWDTHCDVYDFTHKTNFDIRIIIEDKDVCNFAKSDTMTFKLNVKLPGNSDPVIGTDLSPEHLQNGITKKVFETLEFNVFGVDADKDLIVLSGAGKGFTLTNYNISFPQASGNGNVLSHFKWNIACDKLDLKAKSEFDFQFIVVDNANKCRFYKADSLLVKVKLEPPDNQKPLLTITNTNPDLTFTNNHQSLLVGQQISLGLSGTDGDLIPKPDLVKIEMIEARGNIEPAGYLFSPAEGSGNAQTTFSWKIDCSIFEKDVYENNYTFVFRALDNRCLNAKADTVQVDFTMKDVNSSDEDFLPPNVITPNGDNLNDYFAMVRLNKQTLELESILPLDNCVGKFLSILIYDRWGKEVFRSFSRDFIWQPDNEAAGVYFYTLKYSNKDYKGTIHLRN